MNKIVFSLLFASLTSISSTTFAAVEKSQEYKGQPFKGNFSYIVGGEFNGSLGAGRFTEVGVFTSDGKGNVTADALVNIVSNDLSTPLPSGQATYNCTYSNTESSAKSGLILLHCIRHQSNFTPQDQNLDLVLAVVKGSTAKIEALSGGTFGNVVVSGEATRSDD